MKTTATVSCLLTLTLFCVGSGPVMAAVRTDTATVAAPQGPPAKKGAPKLDMAAIKALFGNDPPAPAPKGEVTAEKVALGKLLYHDASLSKGGNISCATCHDLGNYGQDGKVTSPGSDGKGADRNTPSTLNAARQFKATWDGRCDDVEAVIGMSFVDPHQHGLADEAELVAKVKARPELVEAFGKAFGGEITGANVNQAIGAFLRKLVTKSPFDEFLDGNNRALTSEQKWGLKYFVDVGCTTCHNTRLVGGNMMQKLGLFGTYPTDDTGRFRVSGNEAEKGFFKVASLLNVEKTGPYNHNGKMTSLDEVVRTMAQTQLNKKVSDEEVAGIIAFLKALTGKLPEDLAGNGAAR